MKNQLPANPRRRQFITRIVPGCALTCLGAGAICNAIANPKQGSTKESTHKFDTELDEALTYRQLLEKEHFHTIVLGKQLKEELGDGEAIELIKKLSDKRGFEQGKNQAQHSEEKSLQGFVGPFRDPKFLKQFITKEVVEDTENAFEMKVTECLSAEVFRKEEAGDIGFAWICYGDYGWPRGFNPKIRMVRDKTLMQGHAYCNHRYVWTV
jgi:hypothetical protein